jgi:hypothetical protein
MCTHKCTPFGIIRRTIPIPSVWALDSLLPGPPFKITPSDSQIWRILASAIFSLAPSQSVYTRPMRAHVIGNPVPTPEEMGKILGLSPERVATVRRIMNAPDAEKKSPMSKRKSQTDWKRVKAIRESDPIPYSPEDGPYDPNDAKAAKAYLSAAIIRRPGQRGKQKSG